MAFITSVDLHTQLQQGKQQRWPQIRKHALTRHAQKHTRLSAHITQCASPSFHMHSNYTGFSIPATGIIITQLSPSLAPATSSLALFFLSRDSLLLSHSHFLSLFLSNCLQLPTVSVHFIIPVLSCHSQFPVEILYLKKMNLLKQNCAFKSYIWDSGTVLDPIKKISS